MCSHAVEITTMHELEKIPGVGKTIAQYFVDIGIQSIEDLKGQKPEDLYSSLCSHQGKTVDCCMLYVFRCAVYYASTTEHDPELLKWWNWKNEPSKE